MAETGFGSFSYTPLPIYKDWGFGSSIPPLISSNTIIQRTSIGEAKDTGFGSPFDSANYQAEIPVNLQKIPDNGGVTLLIARDWSVTKELFPRVRQYLGSFNVYLIEQATNKETKAQGKRGTDCYTNFRQDNLIAYIEPLNRGVYDIRIEWMEGTHSIYLKDALEVVQRGRCEQAYHIRTHLPSWMKRGAHIHDEETIGIYKKGSVLMELTQSIGESLQVLNGRPCTATTQLYVRNSNVLHVESTLGFPPKGKLYIDGSHFTYTQKTDNTFSGITTRLILKDPIPPKRKVVLDVKSVE